MSYEDLQEHYDYLHELQQNEQFKPNSQHEVIEYSVATSECPTIDAMRKGLYEFLERFRKDHKPEQWNSRVIARRILFCPNSNTWHIIVFLDKRDLTAAKLGAFFDWTKSIGFETAHRLRSSSGEAYDELRAEAEGCIAVIEQKFNDQEFEEKNISIVANLLAKLTH